ncbi:DeoR family transcriptional regulator [Halalkalibacillus sediminis]|uniref:DeoR family transcriptional regulator n=1 Tax=Halalkalibacillus sediminis TaxID=2018042 RepID=A0A2I0QUZ8_9BACI|nr:DeoR family transcriptional regulator [Halalkalibacillus sediminis]
MLYSEERKNQIATFVQKQSRASVQELSEHFGVSESTVRRDLKELEDEEMLRRTHGGAIATETVNFEPTVLEKSDRLKEEKQAIAQAALSYIDENDTILLDSGTTTLQLVPGLKKFQSLTIVTNSVEISEHLRDAPHLEVVVPGGKLRHETQALVGPLTDQILKQLYVDKAFIGTNGVDLAHGLTTPNLIESATKRTMLEQSKEVIVLSDHSKFGKVSFAAFGSIIDQVDVLITDDRVPQDLVEEMRNEGVNIDIATLQGDPS